MQAPGFGKLQWPHATPRNELCASGPKRHRRSSIATQLNGAIATGLSDRLILLILVHGCTLAQRTAHAVKVYLGNGYARSFANLSFRE